MEKSKPHISVVIPVYKCSASIRELYTRLVMVLESINSNFELIFINDASPEDDWNIILEISEKDYRVKGLNLSRNFGQYYAISAGVRIATGLWVVVMDGDLQDQPEEIVKLYEKANQGFDVVFARRSKRQDRFMTKMLSKGFYLVLDFIANTDSDPTVANFSICSHKVIRSLRALKEQMREYQQNIKWLGYNIAYVDVEHAERKAGKTSYTFRKKIHLASEIILSYSNKPLNISVFIGFFISALSLLFGLNLLYSYFFLEKPIQGWTSLIVSIYFMGGMILFTLGIIGIYVGKIFNETKGRPIFIIKDRINLQEDVVDNNDYW